MFCTSASHVQVRRKRDDTRAAQRARAKTRETEQGAVGASTSVPVAVRRIPLKGGAVPEPIPLDDRRETLLAKILNKLVSVPEQQRAATLAAGLEETTEVRRPSK